MFRVTGHLVATLLTTALLTGAPPSRHPAQATRDERALARFADAVRDYAEFGRNGPVLTTESAEALRFQLRFTRWLYRHDPVETLGDPASSVHLDSRQWPTAFDALPPLPDQLEYRRHGRHVLLVDRRTRMVIDILEDALAR